MVEFTATGIFLGITLANERAYAARQRRQQLVVTHASSPGVAVQAAGSLR